MNIKCLPVAVWRIILATGRSSNVDWRLWATEDCNAVLSTCQQQTEVSTHSFTFHNTKNKQLRAIRNYKPPIRIKTSTALANNGDLDNLTSYIH